MTKNMANVTDTFTVIRYGRMKYVIIERCHKKNVIGFE